MKTAHQFSELAVRERALVHGCPACGAAAGVRCRVLSANKTAVGRTKVDVLSSPHPDRVLVAWREMVREEGA